MLTKDQFAIGLLNVLEKDCPCNYCPEYRYYRSVGMVRSEMNKHLVCNVKKLHICEIYLKQEFIEDDKKSCPCDVYKEEALNLAENWLKENDYL